MWKAGLKLSASPSSGTVRVFAGEPTRLRMRSRWFLRFVLGEMEAGALVGFLKVMAGVRGGSIRELSVRRFGEEERRWGVGCRR